MKKSIFLLPLVLLSVFAVSVAYATSPTQSPSPGANWGAATSTGTLSATNLKLYTDAAQRFMQNRGTLDDQLPLSPNAFFVYSVTPGLQTSFSVVSYLNAQNRYMLTRGTLTG